MKHSHPADDIILGRMPNPDTLVGLPTFAMSNPALGNDGTTSSATIPPLLPVMPKPAESTSFPSLPIPPKLVKKILSLDFVEMAELVPESWGVESDTTSQCCHQTRPQPRRGPITDITLWLECYSSLVAVLATRYPQYIGSFMAYQRTIIRASRNYEGSAWVIYDRCFRRRAAATKNLSWGEIDSALYNESFTGRARCIARCRSCLSDNHTEADCPERTWTPTSQTSAYNLPNWIHQGRPWPQLAEICQLFNRVRCKATRCKRRHVCNHCGLPHPEMVCPSLPGRRERSRSPHQQRRARPLRAPGK